MFLAFDGAFYKTFWMFEVFELWDFFSKLKQISVSSSQSVEYVNAC